MSSKAKRVRNLSKTTCNAEVLKNDGDGDGELKNICLNMCVCILRNEYFVVLTKFGDTDGNCVSAESEWELRGGFVGLSLSPPLFLCVYISIVDCVCVYLYMYTEHVGVGA